MVSSLVESIRNVIFCLFHGHFVFFNHHDLQVIAGIKTSYKIAFVVWTFFVFPLQLRWLAVIDTFERKDMARCNFCMSCPLSDSFVDVPPRKVFPTLYTFSDRPETLCYFQRTMSSVYKVLYLIACYFLLYCQPPQWVFVIFLLANPVDFLHLQC